MEENLALDEALLIEADDRPRPAVVRALGPAANIAVVLGARAGWPTTFSSKPAGPTACPSSADQAAAERS